MYGTGFNYVLNMEVFLGMSGAGASPLAYLLWAAELKGMKLVRGGREGDGVYLQAHHTEHPIGQSGLTKCNFKEKEDLPFPREEKEACSRRPLDWWLWSRVAVALASFSTWKHPVNWT